MGAAAVRQALVRELGRSHYQPVFDAMKAFTAARGAATADEIWLTEHEPVFTQGQAGKAEHLLAPGDIPVVQSDRGGQVTYHGPGQIVAYLMLDLRRLDLSVRGLVSGIERAVVETLATYGVAGSPRADAPGVYVAGSKIASLGLRVRRGCSYHGLALNVDMDLEPFSRINPCGLWGVPVTQLTALAEVPSMSAVSERLLDALAGAYELTLRRLDKADPG
jgi:lipoyl(octanoyl) transferase